jgi:hypothetical protein
MNYTKPEITSLASASFLIQSVVGKTTIYHDSSSPEWVTTNAYEADE